MSPVRVTVVWGGGMERRASCGGEPAFPFVSRTRANLVPAPTNEIRGGRLPGRNGRTATRSPAARWTVPTEERDVGNWHRPNRCTLTVENRGQFALRSLEPPPSFRAERGISGRSPWRRSRLLHGLYSKYGFEECGPFGSYVDDPNSVFMTKAL
jgi:hypothetical protein